MGDLKKILCGVLVLFFVAPGSLRAQTTSVWTGDGAMNNWTDPENWENTPAVVAFPDNDGGDHFLVEIPRAVVTLDDDITISSLDLGVDTNEGGFITGDKQLTAEIGTQIGTQGGFDGGGGTFTSEGGIDVSGAFLIDDWTVNAQSTLAVGVGGGDGSVVLEGNALLVLNQGLEFLSNGDLTSPLGSNALVTNLGNFRRDPAATGLSEIGVHFADSSGTISTTSGTLSFLSGRTATLTNSTLEVNANGTLQFGGDTTIAGATTVAGSSVATVRFGGSNAEVALTGALQNEFDAADAPSVVFAGEKFSGGTLNLQAGEGFFHASGNLGVEGLVTNRGRYQWQGGAITGMGLVNENSVAGQTVFSTTTDKIVGGSAVNNMGHITQTGNIRLDADGKVINSIGATYLLQNAIVNAGPDANAETGFFNQGTIESIGNSQFSARLNSSKEIVVKSESLKLAGSTNLTGTPQSPAVVNVAEGANLQIGVNSTSVSNLTNVRFEPSGGIAPPGVTKINFVGGASSLSGLIQSQGIGEIVHESGTVRVRTGESATFEFVDMAPFVIDANPNQATFLVAGSLTNNGAIRWEQGALTGQGTLLNAENGLIEVTGAAQIGDSTSVGVIENDGVINVTTDSLTAFILHANSKIVNRREGLIDFLSGGNLLAASQDSFGSVENNGILGKLGSEKTVTIAVPFEQTPDGILDIQQGTLRFTDVATMRGTIELMKAGDALSDPHVIVDGDSITEDLTLTYDSGTLSYNTPVAIFQGTLSGTGANGRVELRSDFTRINGLVTFDIRDTEGQNSAVDARRGKIEGSGRVINEGNFHLVGSEIVLEGSEPPLGDPAVRPFTNVGNFFWDRGAVGSDFENASAQTAGNIPTMFIRTVADKLLENGTLYNSGHLQHLEGKLRVNSTASIVNQPDGLWQIYNETEIVSPTGSDPGQFSNSGTLQISSFLNNDPATIAIPFASNQGAITGDQDAKLNVSAGYTLQGGKIDLKDRSDLSFGPHGTVDGTTIDSDVSVTISFAGPTISGNLNGSGRGVVTFIDATVERTETVFLDLANARLTGSSRLFGTISNSETLTVDPGAKGVTFVETDASSNPVGSGGILRNLENASLTLVGVNVSHSLASPLAESQWGQIQNEGAMAITGSDQNLNLTLNEVRVRNFEQGLIGASVGTIAGNGKIENQGTFLVRNVTIETPFDNPGVFVAELGNNEIRELAQFQDGVLTGGTYRVTPAAQLLIGSGDLQQNLADITLAGATAQFPGLESLSTSDGALRFEDGHSYQNNADSFRSTGFLSFENALGTFGEIALASGDFTVLNSEIVADRIDFLTQLSARFDGSFITADEVDNGGTLNIGSSPGMATIVGNYKQTGTLAMEIGGLAPGEQYDRLEIIGTANLGGILDVTGLNLGSYSPAPGDSFSLLTSTNPIQGDFDLVNYPETVGGWFVTWQPVDYSNNEVSLQIASVDFLQGDFDEDGDVDGDDLASWQSGYGLVSSATHIDGDADGDMDVDGADFLTWQQQAGLNASSLSAFAVPEPASGFMALCAAGLCGLGFTRRRRRSAVIVHRTSFTRLPTHRVRRDTHRPAFRGNASLPLFW